MDQLDPASEVPPILAGWLYSRRSERGLSQEAVALKAGISVPCYGRIERAGLSQRGTGVTLATLLRIINAIEPTRQELASLILDLTGMNN